MVFMVCMVGCNKIEQKSKNNEQKMNFVIIDKGEEEQLTCASALEEFYEDKNYIYEWSCVKNSYMIVRYENGTTQLVSEALKDGNITITDLDKNNIQYYKRKK